jgi:hypothetical protein
LAGQLFGLGHAAPLTVTGWNGTLTLLAIDVPNWMTALAAGILALWSWVDANISRKAGAYLLAIYGFIHCLYAAVILVSSERGVLGVGPLVVAVGFAVILGMLAKDRRRLSNPRGASQGEPG